jgi:hypothetical protein
MAMTKKPPKKMISEGKEKYASKAAMDKHEKGEGKKAEAMERFKAKIAAAAKKRK